MPNAAAVRAVGLDTPGPASAEGVISSRGATNFSLPEWWGFDVRAALEIPARDPGRVHATTETPPRCMPTTRTSASASLRRSSVSAIVGTGLGGGVIEWGAVVRGAAGMAGELGHVHIPMHGLLAEGQPLPKCNCGFSGDVESVASLTGDPPQPAALLADPVSRSRTWRRLPIDQAARELRTYGERGDEMARKVFEQQAMAIGRLFTIAANFTDPNAYFVGGGVVEAAPEFRDWYLSVVRTNTLLRAGTTRCRRVLARARSRHGGRAWRRGRGPGRVPFLYGSRYHEPELPPPPPPPTLPPENPPNELPTNRRMVPAHCVVLSNDGPMLYSQIGLARLISGAGTLLLASALPHASAAPRATAHALYSRSRPCFHAHSTCLPSLAARNRRNDSARNASAEPVALRAGTSTL